MMTQTQLTAAARGKCGEPLTVVQKESLRCAVAKIVAFGALVGVSAEQMIGMLESGLTISELLQYLTSRTGEIA
jgi:hypothetical protein